MNKLNNPRVYIGMVCVEAHADGLCLIMCFCVQISEWVFSHAKQSDCKSCCQQEDVGFHSLSVRLCVFLSLSGFPSREKGGVGEEAAV